MEMSKMPESSKTAMLNCICSTCKAYEDCLSSSDMEKMKAFCTTGNAMETMKSVCMISDDSEGCMENAKMGSSCIDNMKTEECVCTDCPVADEFQLNDSMFCKG